MDSDTRVRQEATGAGGSVIYQWYCKTCDGYGGWTADEAQARADRAAHQCPDMTKAAPPGP